MVVKLPERIGYKETKEQKTKKNKKMVVKLRERLGNKKETPKTDKLGN